MALQKQLSEEEWAILEIMTDPILLGEYCRNTLDGSPFQEEWPKQGFKYRWYQRDLLSDQSEFISLVAGRSVGKCSPISARIYVYPYGYVTISDLFKLKKKGLLTSIYTVDDKNHWTQKRLSFEFNGYKDVFKITTECGHIFYGTDNHPILTPAGYRPIMELHPGDEVAVTQYLPHDSQQKMFVWEELRFLGYVAGYNILTPEMEVILKYQRNITEMQRIAAYFDARMVPATNGAYRLLRRMGPLKHYATKLYATIGIPSVRSDGFNRVPYVLKAECLENIQIFLESFLVSFCDISLKEIKFKHHRKTFVYDIQELLLRFGIESRINKLDKDDSSRHQFYELVVADYKDIYTLLTTFDLPGVSVSNLKLPTSLADPDNFKKHDRIESIAPVGNQATYAIFVPDTHNYVSDNFMVHNSLVLEDRLIYEAVNWDTEFPGTTKESTLVTANQKQMDPILDRIIMRLSNSRLLKDFLKGGVNRSKGTLDFPTDGGANYRLNARIAGSKGENNMVGLHVPKIYGDEMQIFPMASYIQLGPTYNGYEPNARQFYCGVPNGLREGNVLYFLDQRSAKFKKYRIPAHENPYFTHKDNLESLRQYGGEDADDYQHLVLGRHGDPAFAVIPRDKIRTEPIDFYSHRYTQTDKHAGRGFRQQLQLHKIPDNKAEYKVLALDTGYADPTVAQVICRDKNGIWRTFVRYRMTRIPFPEQADAIDWLDDFYNFNLICIDLGAGGGGIGVSQDLLSDRFSKGKQYNKRVHGVQFANFIDNGEDSSGNALRTQAKSFAGQELARLITEGNLVFSEIDMEGLSQMERVAYQRQANGTSKYFIISDKGTGKSGDDHIFASYIVFVLSLLTRMLEKPRKRLFGASWLN